MNVAVSMKPERKKKILTCVFSPICSQSWFLTLTRSTRHSDLLTHNLCFWVTFSVECPNVSPLKFHFHSLYHPLPCYRQFSTGLISYGSLCRPQHHSYHVTEVLVSFPVVVIKYSTDRT